MNNPTSMAQDALYGIRLAVGCYDYSPSEVFGVIRAAMECIDSLRPVVSTPGQQYTC